MWPKGALKWGTPRITKGQRAGWVLRQRHGEASDVSTSYTQSWVLNHSPAYPRIHWTQHEVSRWFYYLSAVPKLLSSVQVQHSLVKHLLCSNSSLITCIAILIFFWDLPVKPGLKVISQRHHHCKEKTGRRKGKGRRKQSSASNTHGQSKIPS